MYDGLIDADYPQMLQNVKRVRASGTSAGASCWQECTPNKLTWMG